MGREETKLVSLNFHFFKKSLEFRECFFLYARSGQINTLEELTVIMRSLGTSPTSVELRDYMRQKGGKMSFPDFLDVMHTHR